MVYYTYIDTFDADGLNKIKNNKICSQCETAVPI